MTKLIVTTLSLFVLAAPAAPADGKKAVAALVRKAVNEVLTVLKNKEFSREDKRKKVSVIADRLIDFPHMAMLSLGREHWPNLKPSEQTSFTKLFVETLRWSYFEKIYLFTDETVEFGEPVAKNKFFYLVTHILSKGERIEVAYLCRNKKKDTWKACDIVIEGVSMVKSYRSQYADFLREHKFEALLVRMREKIDEARQKDSRFGNKPVKTKKKEKRN